MAKILEEKVVVLEKRLALMERFLHLRYCESFQDFSARHLPSRPAAAAPGFGENEGEDFGDIPDISMDGEGSADEQEQNDSMQVPVATSPVKRSSRGRLIKPKTPGGGAVAVPVQPKKPVISEVRKCTINLERVDGSSKTKYATRRQTKLTEESPGAPLKQESHESMDCDDDNDYLSFPDEEPAGVDDSNADDDTLYTDNQGVEDSPSKPEVKQKKPFRIQIHKPITGLRRKLRREKYNRKRYSTSLLSDEAKLQILRQDPTREMCPVCKKGVKKTLLDQHIAGHSIDTEKKFKCSQCEKRYKENHLLQRHVKLAHEAEKYFPKCRLCQGFMKANTVRHENNCLRRVINDGDPIDPNIIEELRQKCREQGIPFALGDFPPGVDPDEVIACTICDHPVKRRSVEIHMKRTHEEKKFRCEKCSKMFLNKQSLIRHLINHHPDPNATTNPSENPGPMDSSKIPVIVEETCQDTSISGENPENKEKSQMDG